MPNKILTNEQGVSSLLRTHIHYRCSKHRRARISTKYKIEWPTDKGVGKQVAHMARVKKEVNQSLFLQQLWAPAQAGQFILAS